MIITDDYYYYFYNNDDAHEVFTTKCHIHFMLRSSISHRNQGANTLHDSAYIPFAMLLLVYYKNMSSCPDYSDQQRVTCKLLASITQI